MHASQRQCWAEETRGASTRGQSLFPPVQGDCKRTHKPAHAVRCQAGSGPPAGDGPHCAGTFQSADELPFLDLRPGDRDVFSLWKFTKSTFFAICSFSHAHYTARRSFFFEVFNRAVEMSTSHVRVPDSVPSSSLLRMRNPGGSSDGPSNQINQISATHIGYLDWVPGPQLRAGLFLQTFGELVDGSSLCVSLPPK